MNIGIKGYLLCGLVLCGVATTPRVSRADDISVTVKGMVCSFCAQGIKKTFGRNEAVKEIDVNLDSKVVHITTQPQKSLSDEVIKQLITDSGYEVVGIERKADA